MKTLITLFLFPLALFATYAPISEYKLEVSKGNVSGTSVIDKFGENPDVDTNSAPEDIWEFGGTYVFSADNTADIISLSSDDAGDTMDISVLGLDINGEQVTQIITLQGQTRVALTTSLWRVFRIENEGDASEDIAGTIYCYAGTTNTSGTPSGGSIVKAIIDDGNNQTQMAIYTIPLGKVGFLWRGELGASRSNASGSAVCDYRSRRYGKVFKIKKRIALSNSGSSIYQDSRSFPDPIPALTDIKLVIESVSANDMGFFGTLDILLIDEDQLSDAFLAAIGQPSST